MYSYTVFVLANIATFVCRALAQVDEPPTADESTITDTPAMMALLRPLRRTLEEPSPLALMRPDHGTLEKLRPKYLSLDSSEEYQQLDQIPPNGSVSIAKIADTLKQWTALQGHQVQVLHDYAHDHLAPMLNYANEMIINSSISDAAKQAFANITEIISNSDQSINEEPQQIKSFIESLPEDVRHEMATYLKSTIEDALKEMKQKLP
uniref:DUF148 domain-containing protein n=1 Tax=Ascaris lumbricoides TaxID=6252 RepID=A0A0M3I898_ASCLU